jgi:hypothetical protein
MPLTQLRQQGSAGSDSLHTVEFPLLGKRSSMRKARELSWSEWKTETSSGVPAKGGTASAALRFTFYRRLGSFATCDRPFPVTLLAPKDCK